MTKTLNRPTNAVKMRVAIWGTEHKAKLTGMTKVAAAAFIKKELGIDFPLSAVSSIYKALGIDLSTQGRNATCATRNGKNDLKVRLLSRIVKRLYKDLGVAVPANLEALCVGSPIANLETETTAE